MASCVTVSSMTIYGEAVATSCMVKCTSLDHRLYIFEVQSARFWNRNCATWNQDRYPLNHRMCPSEQKSVFEPLSALHWTIKCVPLTAINALLNSECVSLKQRLITQKDAFLNHEIWTYEPWNVLKWSTNCLYRTYHAPLLHRVIMGVWYYLQLPQYVWISVTSRFILWIIGYQFWSIGSDRVGGRSEIYTHQKRNNLLTEIFMFFIMLRNVMRLGRVALHWVGFRYLLSRMISRPYQEEAY